jgi:ATP-dependent Zn protease
MPKLSPYLQKISGIEKTYNTVRPHDWHSSISRMIILRKYGDSAVHEAAHTLTAWYSPTCSIVFQVKIMDSGGVTRLYIPPSLPPNNLSCVLWDTMVIYLAGTAATSMIWPENKPRGINPDIKTASLQAYRLAANDGITGESEPWTDFKDITTPDLHNKWVFNISDEAMRLMRVSYRRTIALMATHEDAFTKLCAGLHKHKKLGMFDLIAILGRKPVLPALAILAHNSINDYTR